MSVDAIARGLAVQGIGQDFGGIAALPNSKLVSRKLGNSSSGQNDLYTVPAGRRALLWRYQAFNTTVSSVTTQHTVKIGSTYYPIRDALTVTASQTNGAGILFVMEAGDIFSALNGASGLNISVALLEFDASGPLKSPRLTSIANGDNLLYTAPANKGAFPLGAAIAGPLGSGALGFYNNTGASRSWIVYQVPNNTTASSSSTRLVGTNTYANGAVSTGPIAVGITALAPNEAIIVNSDGAGAGLIWTTVLETPYA